MKRTTYVVVGLMLMSLYCYGDGMIIDSFDSTGQLRFNQMETSAVYRIEWASTPAGPWTNSWASLTDLSGTTAGIVTVSVPMVYRVVAQTPPANMVLVAPGSFTMGNSTNIFPEGLSSESPQHQVFVSPFFIGIHEVTYQEWEDVRQWALTNGFADIPAGAGKAASHPVQQVSWYAVLAWCNARSVREGLDPVYYRDAAQSLVCTTAVDALYVSADSVRWSANGYRLPTEAEWEKAARGGVDNRRFPWSHSDLITHSNANYTSDAAHPYDVSETRGPHPLYTSGGAPYTSPVGSFPPNDVGLYDMCGNVMEWCWDRYSSTYYANSPVSDPRGPASGSYRVCRGGTYGMQASGCRSSSRWSLNGPGDRWNDTGFRVARSAH
jgi:formylglycine-generating enzyme required for sulfatase activity